MLFCLPQSLLNTTPRGFQSTQLMGKRAESFQKAIPMSDMSNRQERGVLEPALSS